MLYSELQCSEAIRKAVEPVKDEILTYNGSVCDAVWSASAGYNTQTGVYGTCSSRDAWGTEVPYLQSVESPYEEQYHNLLRRSIGKDYTYVEYNDSRLIPMRTPPTRAWAAMCSTTPLCPTGAATATSGSSSRPATALTLARTKTVPPA